MKKEDRFNEMWMDVAAVFARQSHAVRRKVGCIIVNRDRIVSQGWNGTSAGFDNACEGEDGQTLPHVVHAEGNALDKVARDGTGGVEHTTLYTTLEPCLPCSVRIANCGIKHVYYRDAYRSHDGIDYLKKAGVEVNQLQPSSTDK